MSNCKRTQKFIVLCLAGFTAGNLLYLASSFAQKPEQEDISQLRNPFESWFNIARREEKSRIKENKPLEPTETAFELTGIMTGKRNLAIINGEVVTEGDIIEGKKITQIGKTTVMLEEGNKKITLEIKDEF